MVVGWQAIPKSPPLAVRGPPVGSRADGESADVSFARDLGPRGVGVGGGGGI